MKDQQSNTTRDPNHTKKISWIFKAASGVIFCIAIGVLFYLHSVDFLEPQPGHSYEIESHGRVYYWSIQQLTLLWASIILWFVSAIAARIWDYSNGLWRPTFNVFPK